MSSQKDSPHWLDRYATAYHTWKQSTNPNGTITFHRPLGLVETSFDSDGKVDEMDLHDHALNVGRIIEPQKCMSKLHVLPLRRLPAGTFQLGFLIIMAHEISDGLSAYGWFKDLLRILNLPLSELETEITASLNPAAVRAKLPPAQEDLYPRIAGSKARQRWIWAIVRVLRHVKKPLPPSFANPLYRPRRLDEAITLPPT
ncbi:hypothetical protein N0V94_000891, partial [Neodidymelliopsis sp. IMI 364377]